MAQSELRKRSAYFNDASELLVCGLCLYLVELVGVGGHAKTVLHVPAG